MNTTRNRTVLFAAAALGVGLLAPAFASAQAAPDQGDIGLRVRNGRLDTTLVGEDDPNGFAGPTVRAFAAFLGTRETNTGNPAIYSPPPGGQSGTETFVTNTPGFDSLPGTFASGTSVGLDITSHRLLPSNVVRYDPASNSLVPTAVNVQAFFSQPAALGRTTDPFGSDPLYLPVFSGQSDEQEGGRYHRHYNYALFEGGPDPTTGDLMPPSTPGVYVLEADLASTQAGVGRSDPFFLVFGFQTPGEDSVAAINYLNANVVPEPASLGLIGLAGLTLLRRRR